ncbi:MAG: hypothetical protein R3C28_06400 [Pirellulaceae bacterium]
MFRRLKENCVIRNDASGYDHENQPAASDFHLKEQLPELTNRIVGKRILALEPSIIWGIAALQATTWWFPSLNAKSSFRAIRNEKKLHLGNITYHVGDLIDGLHDKLTTQIAHKSNMTIECVEN